MKRSHSPVSDNTIARLVESEYLSDGFVSEISENEKVSSSSSVVDDTDNDPTYDPVGPTTSSGNQGLGLNRLNLVIDTNSDESNSDSFDSEPSRRHRARPNQQGHRLEAVEIPQRSRPNDRNSSSSSAEDSENEPDWVEVNETNDIEHRPLHSIHFQEQPGGFRISEICEFNEPLSPLESPPPPNEIAYPNVKHFGDTSNKEEKKAEDNILYKKKCNGQLKKQGLWPGDNSVPALDDMISSPEDPHVLGYNDCYGSINSPNVTINTPEWENRQTPNKPGLQDSENDKTIVERLVTEIGSDLSSPDHYNAVSDFGNHFLVPETTMATGTQERFMSDGSLTPNHRPRVVATGRGHLPEE
ncbi:hypothetical protein J6590_018843 [Homalodisca vitripennis]|nr:hypothetical protein J6590_018843 [Homalodisca vitripennis]